MHGWCANHQTIARPGRIIPRYNPRYTLFAGQLYFSFLDKHSLIKLHSRWLGFWWKVWLHWFLMLSICLSNEFGTLILVALFAHAITQMFRLTVCWLLTEFSDEWSVLFSCVVLCAWCTAWQYMFIQLTSTQLIKCMLGASLSTIWGVSQNVSRRDLHKIPQVL